MTYPEIDLTTAPPTTSTTTLITTSTIATTTNPTISTNNKTSSIMATTSITTTTDTITSTISTTKTTATPTSTIGMAPISSIYTGAQKYWHPYYIDTIETRVLWMKLKYPKTAARLFDRNYVKRRGLDLSLFAKFAQTRDKTRLKSLSAFKTTRKKWQLWQN